MQRGDARIETIAEITYDGDFPADRPGGVRRGVRIEYDPDDPQLVRLAGEDPDRGTELLVGAVLCLVVGLGAPGFAPVYGSKPATARSERLPLMAHAPQSTAAFDGLLALLAEVRDQYVRSGERFDDELDVVEGYRYVTELLSEASELFFEGDPEQATLLVDRAPGPQVPR